ncbi:MAG TPA: hypothetical protein VFZ04_09640, partial [Longimicrobiales bacterium]
MNRKPKAAAKATRPKRPAPNPTKVAKFARESGVARKKRTLEILARLHKEYPDATCSLTFQNPYQLLVATILSAQCTDERVNQVTPALFKRFPKPGDMSDARPEELEEMIKS